MTDIKTLVADCYSTIKRKDWFTDELADAFATDVSKRLQVQMSDTRTGKRNLRLSGMGPKCPCALWHSIHHPELAEALPAPAEIKYSFGHMIEALAITMAKASGHEVTGEQDAVELDGVLGHRDCVIDGCVVDVKSASSISFSKFKSINYEPYDNFGYLDQLDGYVVASSKDPLVRVHDKGYILAIDKQLGNMWLYEHVVRPDRIKERISYYKQIVGSPSAPKCECGTIPQGKSGNIKLDTRAGYSTYKHVCFPHLRTFLYAGGPEFLSVVKRKPQRQDGSYVTEVDKHGNHVY